ncbi:hypothetical protein [Halorussus sp. AFM4]|uniref:hypothetical protein n=1 Tax=Halorussus sp. AFM4 TaxID=3421651 RepID=UPI003EB7CD98
MSELPVDRVPWRNVGLVVAGLIAGGIVAALDGGVVPPILVIGGTVVAMLLVERYER